MLPNCDIIDILDSKNIGVYMSHPSNDAIASQAETEAIEYVLNLDLAGRGISNHIIDKIKKKKQKEIYEDLINQPGPHG